ncbi:class I SAM-dependent methyltransferase [Dermabacter sp. Marseille-Q3180]|uniref:class I SAM-dependent methyltransferase n=1 Tax=Dermabacter sp. Marseille-Q3180 TaxID=2758090 RepID=UPI002024015C|nr:class I SAM-dependent methyltransferase [Dermabacter sp. Marseille-Q3180]
MASPSDIWSACDYAPTAARLRPVSTLVAAELSRRTPSPATVVDIGSGHGEGVAELLSRGYSVTAIEPTARIRTIGQRLAPEATWIDAFGEATGLEKGSVDAVTSTFGTMFCDPAKGPAEWARILRPDGTLMMTAWNQEGFLATMTDAMNDAIAPDRSTQIPPHMAWGIDDAAHERLSPWFDHISIEHLDLEWSFESVEEGMQLYREGSPTHAWMADNAGARREALWTALRDHLEAHADDSGRIDSTTGYALVTAQRRRDTAR